MTLHEAEAFVGAERCIMKTLTETDLYCEPPEVQPPPKRRQKRDTTHNLPEFIVRAGWPGAGLGQSWGRREGRRAGWAAVGPCEATPVHNTGEVWLPRVGVGPCGV